VTGTLTRVDAVNGIVEIDSVEGPTKTRRHWLLFVDARTKVLRGAARVALAKLRLGRRVTCKVVQQQQAGREDRERLIVSEIRVATRR
jgi:hypothetical protein